MTSIPVSKVLPNPQQPRTVFDETELQGLAQSIKENGLIQPIVVEKSGDQYILVDGERRWRAVKLLGLTEIEAVIRGTKSHVSQRRLAGLVANVQRSDLRPIDQARAYKALVEAMPSQRAVAEATGIADGVISARIVLLSFSEPVQQLFQMGSLPLNNNIIWALKKLAPVEQTRLMTIAVTRGSSAVTIVRLLKRAVSGKGMVRKYHHETREPTVELAGIHFDALALVRGWRELPTAMAQTARKTCQNCDLYQSASVAICKQCPLPDFLIRYRISLKEAKP